MEWDEETIARLRALWADGHSTAEIGRRMGVSKNAVVGKAHRLNLPPRPSPIRRDRAGLRPRPVAVRRIFGPTLPPLLGTEQPAAPVVIAAVEAECVPANETSRVLAPEHVRVGQMVPARPAAVVSAAVRAVPPPRSMRLVACCWPIGEPGTKSFRFCDDDALPGKPYCAEHAQLAYVKVRDRREEAA
jgi:GcrA cell cycle regulator